MAPRADCAVARMAHTEVCPWQPEGSSGICWSTVLPTPLQEEPVRRYRAGSLLVPACEELWLPSALIYQGRDVQLCRGQGQQGDKTPTLHSCVTGTESLTLQVHKSLLCLHADSKTQTEYERL